MRYSGVADLPVVTVAATFVDRTWLPVETEVHPYSAAG
jgi:hypothetical protein